MKIPVEVTRRMGKRKVGDEYQEFAPHARQLAALGFVKLKERKMEQPRIEVPPEQLPEETPPEDEPVEEVRQKRRYRRRDMQVEDTRDDE